MSASIKNIDGSADCRGSEYSLHGSNLARARTHDRRELAARSERELRDMGTCWPSISDEVSKPFWRA
jgi:hypothetical protein